MLDVTQEVLRRAWLSRSPAESAALVGQSARRSAFLASVAQPSPARHPGRDLLGLRADRFDLGLSNPTYLAAPSGTQFLRVKIDSASVRLSFSDPVAESLTPVRPGGRRGEITELSEGARSRLAARAWALTAEGYTPSAMITLTAPANWAEVYVCDADGVSLPGGRLLKQHLDTFRKRLGRFLGRHGLASWSALWFLEFQRRGAPHIHLMLYGCTIPAPVLRSLRSWCGPAWSGIVGNPSRHEQEKHKRAGTNVAKMRVSHFGYAVKYATKCEQKEVPHYFKDVGRFWGCWNYKHTEPVVLDVDYSYLNKRDSNDVIELVRSLLATLPSSAARFAASRLRVVEQMAETGIRHAFGFCIFGAAAAAAARDFFEVGI